MRLEIFLLATFLRAVSSIATESQRLEGDWRRRLSESPQPTPPTTNPSVNPTASRSPTITSTSFPTESTGQPLATANPTAAPSETVFTNAPTLAPSNVPTNSGPPTIPNLETLDDSQRPFDKCRGPCANDGDCLAGLKCQERGHNEPVSGCLGEGDPGIGYCYDPLDGPAAPTLPKGQFRLKLFWMEGYFWQESFIEVEYCLDYDGEGTVPTIQRCRDWSTHFEFVYLEGEGDMIKVADTNHCLERATARSIVFRDCDESSSKQRWKGNWAGHRFDIRPVGRGGCATQHHHPRPAEVVSLHDCERAHLTDTGYWNVF